MRKLFPLICKSILFGLILNASSLFIYSFHSSQAEVLLSEQDEYLYLQEALESGGASLPNIKILTSPSGEKDPRVSGQPHGLLKKSIGSLAYLSGLNVISLNLVLDLFSCAISYLIFFFVFNKLFDGNSPQYSWAFSRPDFLNIVFFCLPWIISPLTRIDMLALPALNNYESVQFFSLYPLSYTCLPVLRSINTQLSYPVLGIALLSLLSGRYFLCGIICGALLYFYMFPWILMIPLACTFIATKQVLNRSTLSSFIKNIALFWSALLAMSLPGLISILRSPLHDTYLIAQDVPMFVFFSPIIIMLILIVLFLLIFKNRRSYIVILTSILISTLIVMNIQPLSGKLLTPYHFLVFYIYPFFSVYLLFAVLSGLAGSRLLTKAAQFIILLASGLSLIIVHEKNMVRYEEGLAERELVSFLRTLDTSGSLVAINPYHDFFKHWWPLYPELKTTPYYIQYMSEQPLFPINYEILDPREKLLSEYYLYYIYRGEVLETDKVDLQDIYYPDFAYGIVSFEAIRRRELFKNHKDSLDKLLPHYKPNIKYLISEPLSFPIEHEYNEKNRKKIWVSSNNKYAVYAIN